MKIFKRLQKLREEDRAATKNSHDLLEELDRTESHVDAEHKEALSWLRKSEKQARRLKDADQRNHYSEGLTESFQGRPAT